MSYKVTGVTLNNLDSKHYSTRIDLSFEDFESCGVEVFGYSSKPSVRELESGWEPEWGMDHVETEVVFEVAKVIEEALKRHFMINTEEGNTQ